MSDTNELPIEIDVASVAEMRNRGDDFLLLDVREPFEHEIANIDGNLLIPMSQLRQRFGELQEHRDRLIVVY